MVLHPINYEAPLYVAGHRGMVGSAVMRALQKRGHRNIVTATSQELDLRNRDKTFQFIQDHRPETVIVAAAHVGGILANKRFPAEFLSDNLLIQVNLMDAAASIGAARLIFLGSSCVYPKFAKQPIPESELLNGPLETTNDAYAVAKIAGIQMVESVRRERGLSWISAMPANLYGPNDNYDELNSHVFAAMVARYVGASNAGIAKVTNWGTGEVFREFLHVDDLAEAVLFLLEHYDDDQHINVGTGSEISLRRLALKIAETAGYRGLSEWDASKPDGTPRKLLDVSKLSALGWTSKIGLDQGISRAVGEYRSAHYTEKGGNS